MKQKELNEIKKNVMMAVIKPKKITKVLLELCKSEDSKHAAILIHSELLIRINFPIDRSI